MKGPSLRVALYNAALLAGSPVLASYLAWRVMKGKSRVGWSERWGELPETMRPGSVPPMWFHAASVGEVMAATPVMNALLERDPECDIVMTTITPGGREVAEGLVGKGIRAAAFLPFDLAPLARRTVGHIGAQLFVGVETEMWPNLLRALTLTHTPSVLINARISDRSFPRYRTVRWLLSETVRSYDAILAQSERDAERFRKLGADTERVTVIGNVKFDQAPEPLTADEARDLRREFGIDTDAPVWVIGSTRTISEERILWAAHQLARQSLPNLVIIHAPRHTDRADEVASGMRAAGLEPRLRSQLSGSGSTRALVLDTFGELSRVYALADVAYVGNSLLAPGGGQNPLQPIAQGKPVLHGPHIGNFRDVMDQAHAAGVVFKVENSRDLAGRLVTLTKDQAQLEHIRMAGLALMRANRGAAGRCAEHLAKYNPNLGTAKRS